MTTKLQLTIEERECAKALVVQQIQDLRDQGFDVEVVTDLEVAATVNVGGVAMLIDPMRLLCSANLGATVH